MSEALIFLVVGGVLAGSLVIAMVASRLGVPSLVAFLALGILLGSEGVAGVTFNDTELVKTVSILGLVVILFEGGLSTSRRRLREAFAPALFLSTIGVVVTAMLTGFAAHYLFDLPWLQSMLLGAVVSSTDAAAVFATLRFTKIRRRLARVLEAESGLNDPLAIALTIGFISWIQEPVYGFGNLAILIAGKLGIGLLIGLLLGRVATYIFSHLPHSIGAFSPVASVSVALLSFGITDIMGGSGFLAVYLVGLALGSTPSRYRGPLTTFHEGLAFLAQVVMFVMMGLFVVPHELWAVALPSIGLGLLLVFFVRPLSVWLSLLFSSFSQEEKALLGWAGLRGAVPIVLGAFVLSAHIEYGELIFNTVFFVVLASTLIQGTILNWVAERLGVTDKIPDDKRALQKDKLEKIYFQVAPQHAIANVMIYEIGLPPGAGVTEIKRRARKIVVHKNAVIKPGDRLCVEAPYSIHPEIEDVFMRWRRRV